MIIPAKQDLVILTALLVTLGLWKGALGWWMGDVPPQEGEEVGEIRSSKQVIDFNWLFPSFPMTSPVKWGLIILVAFLVNLGLCKGPLGWWMGTIPHQKGDVVEGPFTHEKQYLVIFVTFLVALKGAPGGSQRGPWDYEWFIYHLRRKTL